jgi:hypothetical protein
VRRNRPRGQSPTAARCAAISTLALFGSIVAHGTLRALLAFTWVVLALSAFGLEWSARRRARAEAASAAANPVRLKGGRRPRR